VLGLAQGRVLGLAQGRVLGLALRGYKVLKWKTLEQHYDAEQSASESKSMY
jgi:hypothetical protein